MPTTPDPTSTAVERAAPVTSAPTALDPAAPPTEPAPAAAADGDALGPGAAGADKRIRVADRPNVTTVGTMVWLVSQLMFFTGLFGMYFTAKAVTPGAWPPVPLDVGYALGLTVVLLASSVTCQLGAAAAAKGKVAALRRWYLVTSMLGVVFLLGQVNQYRTLVNDGMGLASSAFSGVFYLNTGFHALTVIGGLVAVGLFIARAEPAAFTPAQAVRALVLSYSWLFTTVTWVGVFAAVYLIR